MKPSSRARRDEEFTGFVNDRGDDLLRTAYAMCGDRARAEDLVQTALTKTYLAWPAARRHDPYSYARRALVTTSIDWWRRRRWREVPHATPGEVDDAPVPRGHADRVAEIDAVTRALAALTARERAIVVLRYCEDLSERQVADLLHVSLGTVKSTASRALAKLKVAPALAHDECEEDDHAYH